MSFRFFLLILLFSVFQMPMGFAADRRPILSILTYDSMLGPGSLGEWIERQKKFKIKWVRVNDAGQLLTRLKIEKKRESPSIHLVLGVDFLLLSHFRTLTREVPKSFFENIPWISKIKEQVLNEKSFIPWDWGALGFLVDTDKGLGNTDSILKTVSDLTRPEFQKKWVVQDPRSSTPGLQFVLAASGTESKAPWQELSKSWYSLSPSWDASYGIFQRGQVPMVWTYLTSLAYELKRGGKANRFKWVNLFPKHPIQLEGIILPVWVTADSAQEKEALRFMKFLLSQETQTALLNRQWMFPVVNGVTFPDEYQQLPSVLFEWPKKLESAQVESILKKWRLSLGG